MMGDPPTPLPGWIASLVLSLVLVGLLYWRLR
jgi:hypothetical protein